MNFGGKIYLSTPNGLVCGPAEKSPIYYKIKKYGHYKHYNPSEITAVFENAGFKVDKINYVSYPAGVKLARDILYHRVSNIDNFFLNRLKIKWLSEVYRIVSWPAAAILNFLFRQVDELILAARNNDAKGEETAASLEFFIKKA